MDLFINTAAVDRSASALASAATGAATLEGPDDFPQLVLGTTEPLSVTHLSAPGTVASWSADATYTVSAALGYLTPDGLQVYALADLTTVSGSAKTGDLALTSTTLREAARLAVGQCCFNSRPRTSFGLVLQISVTDPSGERRVYAQLPVTINCRVADYTTTPAPAVNYLTAAEIAAAYVALADMDSIDIARDHGAVGDDSTDNTTAIQNAVDAAAATGGRKAVVVPAGIFRTGQIALKSGVRIYGLGHSSVLKLKNSGNNYVLANTNGAQYVDDVVIENLAIDGNKANAATGGGINLVGRRCVVRGCYIFNTPECAIHFGPAQNGATDVPECGDSQLVNNIIVNASRTTGSAFGGIAIVHGRRILVAENIITSTDGNQTYAIEIETNTGNTGDEIRIVDNIIVGGRIFADFENSSVAGTNIVIEGNSVDARGSAGADQGFSAPIFLRLINGLKVSRNYLIGHGDASYGGISVGKPISNFHISDNTILASMPPSGSGYGIYFENQTGIASAGFLTGNFIIGVEALTFGIYQYNPSGWTNVECRGNHFRNVTTNYTVGTTGAAIADFVAFTGPTEARTYTLPNASTTLLSTSDAVTGSGSLVRATSPTLVTPTLGVAQATTVNVGSGASALGDILNVNGRAAIAAASEFSWRHTTGSSMADLLGVRVDDNNGTLSGRVRVSGSVTERWKADASGVTITGTLTASAATITTGTLTTANVTTVNGTTVNAGSGASALGDTFNVNGRAAIAAASELSWRHTTGSSMTDFVGSRVDDNNGLLLARVRSAGTVTERCRFDASGVSVTGTFKVGGSNGTAMDLVASAVATLDFPSVAASGGVQDLTVTVTGAATGDVVQLGLPAAAASGIVWNAWVSAANTVTVRATNPTGSPIDPASASYRVTVTSF